jgi:hypothetical protein
VKKSVGIISALSLLLAAGVGRTSAQAWSEAFGVGASVAAVNDIGNRFRLDAFDTEDVNAWVEYRASEYVLLRGTFGSMKARGSDPATRPDDRIRYAALSVAYPFREGYYTSSLFGGFGGYQIRPDSLREGDTAQDVRQTVFGFHLGVDGEFRVVRRLFLVGRVTVHFIQADAAHRTLLTAGGGLLYRF